MGPLRSLIRYSRRPGILLPPPAFRTPRRSLPHPPTLAVNKADIIDRIATGTGLTKIETEAVVNGFMTTVLQALEAGDHVELRGFGTFRVQHRAARTARNPRTNEVVQVPDQYVPQFKPSREFRERVDAAWQERGDDR